LAVTTRARDTFDARRRAPPHRDHHHHREEEEDVHAARGGERGDHRHARGTTTTTTTTHKKVFGRRWSDRFEKRVGDGAGGEDEGIGGNEEDEKRGRRREKDAKKTPNVLRFCGTIETAFDVDDATK
tara:strand:+ start:274 stop:654 length:381 start_codon:yes stop_codon:yes gene_type:complete